MSDHIDLGSGGKHGELQIVLECRDCDDFVFPVRRETDPKTVVRCTDCGKKHHVESLTVR